MERRSLIRRSGGGPGETPVVGRRGPEPDMLQDFSLLEWKAGTKIRSRDASERAWLLLSGRVRLRWSGGSGEASRSSLFDEGPWVLHVPPAEEVELEALSDAEVSLHATDNKASFPARLYAPADCREELRGSGAAARIVRTVFDDSNAPKANLVLGEVVALPGHWSSWPPHHHPQPEIYHYRFLPGQGIGFAAVGERAHVIRAGDTTLIREGEVHQQAAAPGYALWYLWVIRHLDGNRYRVPTFVPEHRWTAEEKSEGKGK